MYQKHHLPTKNHNVIHNGVQGSLIVWKKYPVLSQKAAVETRNKKLEYYKTPVTYITFPFPYYLHIILQSYYLTTMFKTFWIIRLFPHRHINHFSVNLTVHSVSTMLAHACSSEPFTTACILETLVSTDDTIYCHVQELLLFVLLPFSSFSATVNKKTQIRIQLIHDTVLIVFYETVILQALPAHLKCG